MLDGAAVEAGVDDKVAEEGLAHAGFQLIKAQDQLIPVVLFFDGPADGISLAGIPVVGNQLVHQAHQLGDVGLRVVFQIVQGLVHREGPYRFFKAKISHFILLLCFYAEHPLRSRGAQGITFDTSS